MKIGTVNHVMYSFLHGYCAVEITLKISGEIILVFANDSPVRKVIESTNMKSPTNVRQNPYQALQL